MSYVITGGNRTERFIAESCLRWCIAKFPLNRVKIHLRFAPIVSAQGWCLEGELNREYNITISTKYHSISLMAKTIIHELVHVKQWTTGEWDISDDGEKEADEIAKDIGNMLWKADLI